MTSASANRITPDLGLRLRRARLRQGLSQEELAQPEFSKRYISAIERGKAWPSPKAVELLARRLGIAATRLLPEQSESAGNPSPAVPEEDLAFQLDCARREIDTGRAQEGLRLLSVAERSIGAAWENIGTYNRFRFHYLCALAYIRLGEPLVAQHELVLAGEFAAQLTDGGEATVRVHNLVGGAYYQQDLPILAAREHEACMKAIRAGASKDPNLRLLVLSNLGSDYLMIGKPRQAVSTYKEALRVLDEVSNAEREAAIYWGLCMAHRELGDLVRAKLYARRALEIYEAARNMTAVAQMSVNLAKILTQNGEFAQAEQALERALCVLAASDDPVALSTIYQRYTDLELKRGNVAQAEVYARQAVELSEQSYRQAQTAVDESTHANVLRSYARALRLAGLVAEGQQDTARADACFKQALTLTQQAENRETESEIARSYAELLTARGSHEEAGVYYREALKYRSVGYS